MVNTINEARTPGELAAWLRQWADGADASDCLDDNDARQLAEAVERVCAPGNAAAMRGALDKAECVLLVAARFATDNAFTDADARENLRDVDWDGALAEVDAALAAPARNCDRFEDGPDALDAYKGTLRDGEEVQA